MKIYGYKKFVQIIYAQEGYIKSMGLSVGQQ